MPPLMCAKCFLFSCKCGFVQGSSKKRRILVSTHLYPPPPYYSHNYSRARNNSNLTSVSSVDWLSKERATHFHLHTFLIAFNLPGSIHKSVCESIVKAPQSQPRNFPDFNDNSEML